MLDIATLEKHPEFSGLFEPMFTDYVTLDPSESEKQWDRLGRDTSHHFIDSLPKLLALAFIVTLQKEKLPNVAQKTSKTPRKKIKRQ